MPIISGKHRVSPAVDMIWPCCGSDDMPSNRPRDCVIHMLASRQMSFPSSATTIPMLRSFVRTTNKGIKSTTRTIKMSNKSHPDADLFPHATGLAQKTVEEHQAEQPLKLYAGWFCPFVGRAWTVLQEKNIPYQYIEVSRHYSCMLSQR